MATSLRCVVYATSKQDVEAFARAIARADGPWTPVAVSPPLIDAAVRALEPEAVVIDGRQPRAASLLRQIRSRYGRRRLVVDDGSLDALTKLLSLAA